MSTDSPGGADPAPDSILVEAERLTKGARQANYGHQETVAHEAMRLVDGDRQDAYDHPLDNFRRTALIWEAVLGHPVTEEQVALCMIGVKLARQAHSQRRDNIVDLIGYAITHEKCGEERARRADRA